QMPLESRPSANSAKMQTKRSAWTPLNHPLINTKVHISRFSEALLMWSDSQRKAVLQDFMLNCSEEQLQFLNLKVNKVLPLQTADFTCLLPRVLCLYLFSFLDPRSLCRCAQVSWHWKSIVELDQLWMPKCLRRGWCITFSPSPFEQGVWKRHYIESVQELQLRLLQAPKSINKGVDGSRTADISLQDVAAAKQEHPPATSSGLKTEKKAKALPPWRHSDRHPKDTIRFNYLDNLHPIDQALTYGGSQSSEGKRKTLSEASYKLRKAKSMVNPTLCCTTAG
uniref:F-box protein 16 n=1 Tax=Cyprinodon variegatus TaxID=28743 RepID=A0A3Q2CEN0_CYPVA